jgi:hypothetical protein
MQIRYGFRIAAMWETKFGDRTEFAYLLEWPDEATKTAAWSAFMADTEWSDIKRVTHAEHGLMVGQRQEPSCGISVEKIGHEPRTKTKRRAFALRPGCEIVIKSACPYTASRR